MNLQEHYNQLYQNSAKEILEENYTVDSQINGATDSRFGITLVIRPNDENKAKIQLFLSELKEVDSKQYYYPNSDIHITVMSIISCYDGFTLNKIRIEEYIEIIQKSLIHLNKIKIEFKGVTASPSAIMIQGFPSDESLNNLRNILRENFKKSNLEQSIDSRYAIATAHLTVVRFQEKLENPKKLIAVVEKFRDFDFGEFDVKSLELVFNDWYQRESNTIHLADLYL
jgi:2'-5' RNA ligase